ncbi:hypothetical protein [Methanosarcina vacuolata]|uniref:hypothetical protein n=1 Tax=Methanosarcina vacuolata TaxID=2215 RepID=UPI0012F6F029|nr:hypothetical protein [Methanosarcina vacuolata]
MQDIEKAQSDYWKQIDQMQTVPVENMRLENEELLKNILKELKGISRKLDTLGEISKELKEIREISKNLTIAGETANTCIGIA